MLVRWSIFCRKASMSLRARHAARSSPTPRLLSLARRPANSAVGTLATGNTGNTGGGSKSSPTAKKVPVQSYNSFLDQRSVP